MGVIDYLTRRRVASLLADDELVIGSAECPWLTGVTDGNDVGIESPHAATVYKRGGWVSMVGEARATVPGDSFSGLFVLPERFRPAGEVYGLHFLALVWPEPNSFGRLFVNNNDSGTHGLVAARWPDDHSGDSLVVELTALHYYAGD